MVVRVERFHGRYDNPNCLFDNEQVWDRIAPGLASEFDAPHSLRAIAPRPLLILNGKTNIALVKITSSFIKFLNQENITGEKDPRTPVTGLEVPVSIVRKAYEDANCAHHFKVSYSKHCP